MAKSKRHYIHMYYKGSFNQGKASAEGSTFLSFDRLNYQNLVSIARNNLEANSKIKLDCDPVIANISILTKELFEMFNNSNTSEG